MEQITRETFKQSFLLRWLRVMRLRYSPIPPSQTNSCLLGRQCDPFGVHVLPPPSHLSHLILDRYQDSDLPLTYVEGLSALHHSASGGGVTPNNPISPPRTESWERSLVLNLLARPGAPALSSACIMTHFGCLSSFLLPGNSLRHRSE